jgi:hypothetical protein
MPASDCAKPPACVIIAGHVRGPLFNFIRPIHYRLLGYDAM